MKIAIRMLKVATVILWVIILFFSATAVYSVTKMGVSVGEAQIMPSSTGIRFSLPFSIENGGYYEIADLNLTTLVTDQYGTVLDETETFVASIPRNSTVDASHVVEVDLDDLLSVNQTALLLEDGEFDVQVFAGLNYARMVPVQLSLNTTIPWGAPFANFEVGDISVSIYNNTHMQAVIPISFENNAILDITGDLSIDVYNDYGVRVASGSTSLNALSGYAIYGDIPLFVRTQDVLSLTGSGRMHIVFVTPMFTIEWDEYYG